METGKERRFRMLINWRWLVVTYCFLILFSLFPTFLAFGTEVFFQSYATQWFTLWAGGSMAVVCAFVGARSKGITLLEPGIASMLYVLTLIAAFELPWENVKGFSRVEFKIGLFLLAFLIGFGAAAMGEWMQMRREKRLKLSEGGSESKVGS
ncbi:MAG: hypothetical protein FJY85_00145 [Deltaproteobacteria bacterium]|nr:hypothetical protein [Deltaproteobacteria bacterium]